MTPANVVTRLRALYGRGAQSAHVTMRARTIGLTVLDANEQPLQPLNDAWDDVMELLDDLKPGSFDLQRPRQTHNPTAKGQGAPPQAPQAHLDATPEHPGALLGLPWEETTPGIPTGPVAAYAAEPGDTRQLTTLPWEAPGWPNQSVREGTEANFTQDPHATDSGELLDLPWASMESA